MQSLQTIAHRYKLTYKNLTFWSVYWINLPGVAPSPLKGKASPEALQKAVIESFDQDPDGFKTAEEARYQMMRCALGVDCAGFVYHTLSAYLDQFGVKLADNLSIPKQDMLRLTGQEQWRQQYDLSDKEAAELPDQVPASWVQQRYGRDPAHHINSARLASDAATVLVQDSYAIGDIIYIKKDTIDHSLLIVATEGSTYTVMDSKFDPVGPGGIRTQHLSNAQIAELGVVRRLRCMPKDRANA